MYVSERALSLPCFRQACLCFSHVGRNGLCSLISPYQPRERKGAYFFTELRAGLATFFAMAYIISVNANITRYAVAVTP